MNRRGIDVWLLTAIDRKWPDEHGWVALPQPIASVVSDEIGAPARALTASKGPHSVAPRVVAAATGCSGSSENQVARIDGS